MGKEEERKGREGLAPLLKQIMSLFLLLLPDVIEEVRMLWQNIQMVRNHVDPSKTTERKYRMVIWSNQPRSLSPVAEVSGEGEGKQVHLSLSTLGLNLLR